MNFKVFLSLIFAIQTVSAQEVTLDHAYTSALNKETNQLRNQSIKGQSESRLKQARSYLFPSVSLTGRLEKSEFEEETTALRTSSDTTSMSALLRQPLFRGGLYSGVQAEKARAELANLNVKQNNLDLFIEVAQSFYRIQILESTLEVVRDVDKVSSKRVNILRDRAKIGKSKQTDILTNDIQNKSLKIELRQVETLLKAERERFANLTSLPAESKMAKSLEIPALQPLDFYLSKVDETLEVQIQDRNTYIAEKTESVKSSQHLPSLHLDLSATVTEHDPLRPASGKEYAGALVLELPLFLGGRTSAEAQEAEWKKVEERAKLRSLKDEVTVAIKNQYNELKKWIDLHKVYEEALSTARKNYQIFNKETNLGLVSNLELLNSLTTYLDAKKAQDEAFYQLKMSELALLRMIGEKK